MSTNLNIDNALLEEAKRLGGFKTKKDTVNMILKDFVKRQQQKKIVELFGKIDYDEKYDYKRMRHRKPDVA